MVINHNHGSVEQELCGVDVTGRGPLPRVCICICVCDSRTRICFERERGYVMLSVIRGKKSVAVLLSPALFDRELRLPGSVRDLLDRVHLHAVPRVGDTV